MTENRHSVIEHLRANRAIAISLCCQRSMGGSKCLAVVLFFPVAESQDRHSITSIANAIALMHSLGNFLC
ncbi:MAG TPA: hypothetical protein V6C85_38250 [Allocoleopsis sp.]